ncbi:hypothetical protein QUB80_11495 [Chlorogloeopsis sp. ULAP01]|uniref:DUF389 domain-containing protein n=1 Tax=Chlorogloeopsis sp. ULAP01 TaxID=3056483 RepID=UPI0025AB3278|nr:DUF389 domain-containing protein [Chlorogloeopsis sp. ULAP01]MDM9381328.1 hypothetical protein [Chlorogloeopsis sp. ULAP01]
MAVALVPPLSVVSIGLGGSSQSVATGATVLFLANLTGIIFSGTLVFIAQGYGSLERARQGLIISIGAILLLGLPLGFSLANVLIKEQARRSINYLLSRKSLTFSSTDIRDIQIRRQGRELVFNLEVATALNSISENQVNLVRDFLEQNLKRPINLNVRIIPIQEFFSPASGT